MLDIIKKSDKDETVALLYMLLFADLAGGKMIYRMLSHNSNPLLNCFTHLAFCRHISTETKNEFRDQLDLNLSQEANIAALFSKMTRHYHATLQDTVKNHDKSTQTATNTIGKKSTSENFQTKTEKSRGRLYDAFMSGPNHKEMESTQKRILQDRNATLQHIQDKKIIMTSLLSQLLNIAANPQQQKLKNLVTTLESNNIITKTHTDVTNRIRSDSDTLASYMGALKRDHDTAKKLAAKLGIRNKFASLENKSTSTHSFTQEMPQENNSNERTASLLEKVSLFLVLMGIPLLIHFCTRSSIEFFSTEDSALAFHPGL